MIVVDVQQGFVNEHTAHIPARVEALQQAYGTVFVTKFSNPEGSLYRRLMGWTRFAPGSPDTELAFTPAATAEVLDKAVYTCVTPALADRLRRDGIDEVHLCGIDTDMCVAKSAIDLAEAGFRPIVLGDACASHGGPEHHAAALSMLVRAIGRDQVV